jgi:hypothetical protein
MTAGSVEPSCRRNTEQDEQEQHSDLRHEEDGLRLRRRQGVCSRGRESWPPGTVPAGELLVAKQSKKDDEARDDTDQAQRNMQQEIVEWQISARIELSR